MTAPNKPAEPPPPPKHTIPSTKLSNDVEVTSSSPNDRRTAIAWGYVAAYPHE